MNKHLFLFFILVISVLSINFVCASEISVQTSALSNKEIRTQINKIKTKRIIIANTLLLDSEQKKKANDIYSKIIEKEAMLFAQLQKEQEILKSMTKENSTKSERRAQRKVVNSLYKAIKTSENATDKEFKKILNHNQRVKFNRLKKEITISDF